jgi:hypothetical protein
MRNELFAFFALFAPFFASLRLKQFASAKKGNGDDRSMPAVSSPYSLPPRCVRHAMQTLTKSAYARLVFTGV